MWGAASRAWRRACQINGICHASLKMQHEGCDGHADAPSVYDGGVLLDLPRLPWARKTARVTKEIYARCRQTPSTL